MKQASRVWSALLLCFFLLGGAAALQAQEFGTLAGKVVDRNEKLPLPTVRVTVAGQKLYGLTGPDGTFIIRNVPAGSHKVVFELSGYLTETLKDVQITMGATTDVNVVLDQGFAHEVTVTARRAVESLQKVPQNVEVLTETKLDETPQVNIVAALNQVPGVDVENATGQTTIGTFMYIDGYEDIYIRKMVDGVDVSEVVGNWSTLNSFPQEMISQVEVIKGGSSSVWGSNMGGIINVVTKRPKDMTRPEITFRGWYSHFNAMDFTGANAVGNKGSLYNLSFDAIGNIKKFGYMVGYNNNRNDGFAEYGLEKNNSIFGKFSLDLNDHTFIDLLLNRNKMNNQNHAYLYLPDLLGPDYPYYWNYTMDAGSTTDVASLRFSTNISPAVNIEAQLKYNRTTINSVMTYLDGSYYQAPEGTVLSYRYVDQKKGFTLKGAYNPSEAFSLVSGVDYYRIMADYSGYIADQPIIYIDEVAPFANAEYRIGNLGLHAGARYDYDSSFGSQLSPSVGATYNFGKASLFRVNVARTFKVPPLWYTLGESYYDLILPNPDLKPERAWAYSAGFETQELRYIYIKVSGYYHLMTDGIVRVPSEEYEGRYTWGNLSKFTRKGYEAVLGFLTPIGISGHIGTNYNKHEDTTDEGAAVLTWIPTRTYKTGLKYKNDKWDFVANMTGRWIWWNLDADNAYIFNPKDKVWIFDFRASKGFKLSGSMSMSLFLDIYNLGNTPYWDRSDLPGARRWGKLGFEIKFK